MNDNKPLVIFVPSGKRGRFTVGTPVLEAARQLGVDLDSVCGGRGICSRCQVSPSFGSFPKHGIEATESSVSCWNQVEERYHSKRGLKKGRRLGCQAKILGDLVIDVPPESQVHQQVIRKAADTRTIETDPAIRLYFVEVDQPDMFNPAGDIERVAHALESQWDVANASATSFVLRKLQPTLRRGDWKVTVAVRHGVGDRGNVILETWPGYYGGSVHGFAVDLGSTTIAMHLCDLRNGKVVSSAGVMNPQIRFGEDLMSRVSYSMLNEGGSAEMTEVVREVLDDLARRTAKQAGVELESVLEAVIVGNPVMHHLLLGVDPVELGQAPFALATASSLELCAWELGLNAINPHAEIYVLPCVAGHVGADAAAVILSEAPQTSTDRVLIVDVGTNAEIIFGDSTKVLACSSPTGPAFEGAQISSGQRATPGAIERVEINRHTLEPRFKVVGGKHWSDEEGFDDEALNTGVSGICGSGIIEAVAELRMVGIIDRSGLIGSAEQLKTSRLVKTGRTNAYLLYEAAEDGTGRILITQNDVRAIQLAKSALYAGARLLMDHFGAENVDRIVLAGAFGSHISTKHAMVLGMIPDCQLDKVSSSGNAAGTGARIALCNHSSRNEIEQIVSRIEKIETAVEPRFQEHFVNANSLPHAVDRFPNLEKVVVLPNALHNESTTTGGVSGARRRRRRRK